MLSLSLSLPPSAIKASWPCLKDRVKEIGVLAFLHLFDENPEAQLAFKSFQEVAREDLKDNEIFHNHATRVMRVLTKVR